MPGDDAALGRSWLLFLWSPGIFLDQTFNVQNEYVSMKKHFCFFLSFFLVMQKILQTFLAHYICKSEVQIRTFPEKEIIAARLVTAEQSCHRTLFSHHGLTVAFTAMPELSFCVTPLGMLKIAKWGSHIETVGEKNEMSLKR